MDRRLYSIFVLVCLVASSKSICPSECYCFHGDTYVDCSGRNLGGLPENIDDQTIYLDISNNQFESIPSELKNLEHLEHLDISYNSITSLKEYDFENNKKLRNLNLSSNKFASWMDIDHRSFENLQSLETLLLKNNNFQDFGIVQIQSDRFLISNSIRNLSLANCSIQNLSPYTLDGLSNIKILDLSYNNITIFNTPIKSNTLTTLDLTNSGIHKISDPFFQLIALQKLKIPYNSQLKSFYGRSSSIIHIDATHCGLDALPRGSFPKLKSAIFRDNHLRNLPNKTFSSMENINEIDLSHNTIKSIDPDAFYGLKTIQYVDLSYNTITNLDQRTFNSNFRLTLLRLSHNYIKEVVKLDSESLKALVLSNCEITTFHKDSLTMMPSLEYLDLSTNLIRVIPDFLQAEKLEILDVSTCKISRITNNTFAGMPRLRKLYLRGNRLTSEIRPSFFYNIFEVHLSDNSWRCECDNPDFKDLYYWLISGAVTTSINDLVCQSPEYVQGHKWGVACYESWNRHADKAWIYTVTILIMLVAFFCVILSIKKRMKRRVDEEMRERQQNIAEARERLQRMREQEREIRMTESTNAPDPRELQSPPSYADALNMPKLSRSQGSLAGSQGSLGGSNTDLKSGHKKRRRRRKRAASAEDVRRTPDSDTEHNHRLYIESDV